MEGGYRMWVWRAVGEPVIIVRKQYWQWEEQANAEGQK